MIPTINWSVHVSFNGNCAEAMQCYRQCFGGELDIQPLPDAIAGMLPGNRLKVVTARLQLPGFTIYGSDLIDETGGFSTSKIQLSVTVTDQEMLQHICAMLTNEPRMTGSINKVSITDKFGVQWLVKTPAL